MTEKERVEGMLIENRLSELKTTVSLLRVAEADVDNLRDAKWELVKELEAKGHDFKK